MKPYEYVETTIIFKWEKFKVVYQLVYGKLTSSCISHSSENIDSIINIILHTMIKRSHFDLFVII